MHRKSDCNSALGLFGVLGLISFLTVRPIITFLHSLLLTDGIKTAWNSYVNKTCHFSVILISCFLLPCTLVIPVSHIQTALYYG